MNTAPTRLLPAGDVTFMFTDIEGSTRLASGLGAEPYRIVLHRHRAVIREVLRQHRGAEIETEGDSFFVAFPTAGDAAAAALQIQRSLHATDWPDLGRTATGNAAGAIRPRVRMGLHTGEAWPSAGGYATPEVHRTARICSAAHGDQIIGSTQFATAAGLEHHGFERLGDFELRGLPGTTELVQLNAPGLPQEFPPPPIRPRRHNLPAPLKRPVDRGDDYIELDRAFDRHRLVTLTGLTGCGKTTLALAWAERRLPYHPDGVWYCSAGTDLAGSLLDALGSPRESLRRPTEIAVERLRGREALLVLDDVDRRHARVVEQLLRDCPGLTVLATGVRPLELPGEAKRTLQPPPLDVAAAILADHCEDRGLGSAAPAAGDCRRLAAAVDGFLPALRALTDLTALAGPGRALRRLRENPLGTLDAGGRFRAVVDDALALISGPARAILTELAAQTEGATVDQVFELCRQRDGNLEALVELVDVALVMVERPGGEAVYRVPAPLRWLLAPSPVPAGRPRPPALSSALANMVLIEPGYIDPGLVHTR